jgi:hypothetical protein
LIFVASIGCIRTGLRRRRTSREPVLDHDILEYLKSLHTSAVDARNGYQEALKDAEGKD